jgi:hypothetical protein
MKNPIKVLTAVGAILLNPLMPKASAEVKGNIEYIQSENNDNSYARTNAFYTLPNQIEGFTLGEFYKGGDGYFGVTFLEKSIGKGINSRVRIEHDNKPCSEGSVGASVKIPGLPKNVSGELSWDALWLNLKGEIVDKSVAGYSVSMELPYGFTLGTFGELHLAKPEGLTWKYGEIDFNRKFGNFNLGYNPALNSTEDGKLSPKLEHRVTGRVNF